MNVSSVISSKCRNASFCGNMDPLRNNVSTLQWVFLFALTYSKLTFFTFTHAFFFKFFKNFTHAFLQKLFFIKKEDTLIPSFLLIHKTHFVTRPLSSKTVYYDLSFPSEHCLSFMTEDGLISAACLPGLFHLASGLSASGSASCC